VSQNANINALSSGFPNGGYPSGTPLHFATVKGHLDIVEYLINHKANINAKSEDIGILYEVIPLFIMLLKKVIFK